jgi:hypothetical protein
VKIQFVDYDQKKNLYTCQFAGEPGRTARFTHYDLDRLRVDAYQFHQLHNEEPDPRIHTLFFDVLQKVSAVRCKSPSDRTGNPSSCFYCGSLDHQSIECSQRD